MAALASLSRRLFATCRSTSISTGAIGFTAETRFGGAFVPLAVSTIYPSFDTLSPHHHLDAHQAAELRTASPPQDLPVDVGLQAARLLLPSTTSRTQALMQPFVQEHNAARDAAEEKIFMKVLESCSPQPLLRLPDEALHLVAAHLPSTCTAQLQKTCKHMYTLFDEDRFWQDKLRALHPYWAAAGIQPTSALQHGQTWKQLMLSAGQLRTHTGSFANAHATTAQIQSTTLATWLPGNIAQTDLQLSWAAHQAAAAAGLVNHPEQVQRITHRISSLLDLVHFQWYERCQLAKGAACLAQAVALLAELLSCDDLRQQLHQSSSDLAVAAAAAGAYLVELLELRVWQHSIMTITDADSFHRASRELADGDEVAIPPSTSAGLNWFGNEYSWEDLRGALGVVAGPDTQPADLIPSQQQDPLHPATWRLLNPQALSLLEALNAPTENAQQDATKSALFERAASFPENAVSRSPYSACQAHHMYAGAALLARMTPAENWWEIACVHAHMWLAAKQPLRAAHIAKMCHMQLTDNGDSSAWVHVMVAEAYFQHWEQTGTFDSFGRAFAWHRSVILRNRIKVTTATPRVMVQRLLKSWSNIAQLLQQDSLIAKVLPSLKPRDRQLIIVGACSAALDKAGCAEISLKIPKLHFYGHVVREAAFALWCFLDTLFDSKDARLHIRLALSLLQHIPSAAHQMASAELSQITAAADFAPAEDTTPFVSLLHTTMQSLHSSVPA